MRQNAAETYGRTEGSVAKAIERQTEKIPSAVFLWAALRVFQKRDTSYFFSQLTPVFLILGLYNKLVKVAGSQGAPPRAAGEAGGPRNARL